MADIGIHSEEEFRECFSLFDKDKKGAIDEFNFGGCLRSMALNPTEKETKELFAEVAKDVEGVQKADVDAVLAAGRKYAKVMAAAVQEQGLRDALKVGNIQLSTHFFSLKLGVNEAIKVIRSELTNFAIVVEPPKTTFGKVRKTYTGKIQGEQDDVAIAIQLAITGLRCFYQNPKYDRFRPEM